MPTDFATRIARVTAFYGPDGTPGPEGWNRLKACAPDAPITLVNLFRFLDTATYPDGTTCSGQEAFERYTAVSIPSVAAVGGEFLLVTPSLGTFIGAEQDWDLIAIGCYPTPSALIELFELDAYRASYPHRTAACAAQQVTLCPGKPPKHVALPQPNG